VNTTPIIIHQVGKVASQTIEQTLKKALPQTPIFCANMLNQISWANAEQLINLPQSYSMPEHRQSWINLVQEGRTFREQIENYKRLIDSGFITQKLNVITLTREPFSLAISAFFHSLSLFFPNIEQRFKTECNNKLFEEIRDFYLNYVNSFLQGQQAEDTAQFRLFKTLHSDISSFFDEELKPVFDIDVYNSSFDFAKGYQIYESRYARLVLIRVEDLNRVIHTAFNEFLGLGHFELCNTNLSSEKYYNNTYTKFKDTVTFPQDFVDVHYSTKHAHHFYSQDELAGFRQKWIKQESVCNANPQQPVSTGAVELNQKGEEFFGQGNLDLAEDYFQKAIVSQPDHATAHNNLGVLFWEKGNIKQSLLHFKEALSICPDDRTTVLNAGETLVKLGQVNDALSLYSLYQQKHPNDPEITLKINELKGNSQQKLNTQSYSPGTGKLNMETSYFQQSSK